MKDDVSTPAAASAPASVQGAAIALWVVVGGLLAYGIWETVQKVSALFG
ncbi:MULTISPECIES: hypothetical protein [Kineosporia]|uniref:Uncharacterized protein n=1 Tax=Kineosporia mesophila TaxID=566012 RepID=A0ABP6Z7D9_9ACTN|nr:MULTISPECIES: hypothetical protein [Kineosporia]MCD5354989.1 hypothetical protein [Kineosporia mesophila]GLY29469.1 hypothetical protein Kisp02_28340 [Kineosporia sp. NBRC 101731]